MWTEPRRNVFQHQQGDNVQELSDFEIEYVYGGVPYPGSNLPGWMEYVNEQWRRMQGIANDAELNQ